MNQKLLLKYLAQMKHSPPLVAKNGLEAVRLFEATGTVDLIIMDIYMPEMDGISATKWIRAHETLRTPIIAVTAQINDREACLEAGVDAFLSKPFKLEILKDAIDRVTRSVLQQTTDE